MQELLTYLGSISPKTLVISAPTRVLDATNPGSALHNRFLEKLRLLEKDGCRILWITGDNPPTHIDFIEFADEVGLHSKTRHTWFPPAGIQGLNGMIAELYLKTGILSYGLLKLLGGRKRDISGSSGRYAGLCSKKLARIAQQRGFTELIVTGADSPFKELRESKYGKCTVMAPGNWSSHLTALEFNFNRWKSYSYNGDKLLPFFADEQLKRMNSADLQQLINPGKSGGETLSRPA